MAKQRDWMDWVNTGATVLQATQTAEIKSHLARLANAEAQREQRAAMHRLYRDFLIQMDEKIAKLVEASVAIPKASYAAARMLQERFEREKFTPSVFDDWTDIDRAKATMAKLATLMIDTAAKSGPAWEKEVTECLAIQSNISDLEKLVDHAEEWDRLRPLADELERLEAELPTLPLPMLHKLSKVMSAALLAVSLCGLWAALIFAFNEQAVGAIDRMGYALQVSVVSVVLAGVFYTTANVALRDSARGKALARVASIKAILSKPHEQALLALAEKIGESKPSSELIALLHTRKQRIAALFDSDPEPEPAEGNVSFTN
jgi:hypothetical protein